MVCLVIRDFNNDRHSLLFETFPHSHSVLCDEEDARAMDITGTDGFVHEKRFRDRDTIQQRNNGVSYKKATYKNYSNPQAVADLKRWI